MSVILQAENVVKRYGAFTALDGVGFPVSEGEFLAIVGPNGAGKTTLVNVLTGLLKPSQGRVMFKGQDVAGIGPVRLAALGMARAFQLVHIFPDLTVGETIAVGVISQLRRSHRLFGSLGDDHEVHGRVAEIARIFGLEQKLDRTARLLSQGEKKLLDVASAFALRPEVILLDEPTSGVSTGDKRGIMKVLLGAAKQIGVRAMILVEHDMDLVAEHATRIVALQEGRVLADLPPDQFFNDAAIVAAVVGKRKAS
jgi:branched-chain amino acid transport system ATP-binding protein